MRRLARFAGALFALGLSAPAQAEHAPWPTDATWRLHVEQVVDTDRWRGAVVEAVDRAAVRHRLGLDLFLLRPDARGRGPRLTFVSDLEVAADLGVDGQELRAQPDGRRTALDAYRFAFDLQSPWLDARAGRHMLVGAFGFDALDGVSVDAHLLPWVTFHGGAGLAARRRWSSFGPDVFEPDGQGLANQPGRLYLAGASLRRIDGVRARVDWRLNRDDVATQREDVTASVRVGPWATAWLEGVARYDLVAHLPNELSAQIGARPVRPLALRGGWRRQVPTFAADSIWNAFGATPFDEAHGSADLRLGAWRLATDAALRWFDAGAGLADDGDPNVDAGLRLQHRWDVIGHPAHLGAEGRLGTGWGGDRHYANLFGSLPVALSGGEQPVVLRARLGALWFTDPDRPERDGPSGWAVFAARWRAAESIRLEALAEGHAGVVTPYRLRVMSRVIFEDWW